MVTELNPANPLTENFRTDIQDAMLAWIDRQRPLMTQVGPELDAFVDLATTFSAGGKRLRPAFSVWGYVAAAGLPDEEMYAPLIRASAALEMLHVSALMHDDVMDNSDTRRGVDAAHIQLGALHADQNWKGSSAEFGQAGAVLLGDLMLMWVDDMVAEAGLPHEDLQRARPFLSLMRTEMACGQFLDVTAQALPLEPERLEQNIDQVSRVVEFKAGRYSVRRPLQFGAAVGAASPDLQQALGAYGSPLGRAFQYRDDVLGVFGDEDTIGKPAGGDLKEGKHTLLLTHALAASSEAGRNRLLSLVGSPDLSPEGVAEARDIITESGALRQVEDAIDTHYEEAIAALDTAEMTPQGKEGLIGLARAAVHRDI